MTAKSSNVEMIGFCIRLSRKYRVFWKKEENLTSAT